jgi:hypothetical protein
MVTGTLKLIPMSFEAPARERRITDIEGNPS